MDKSAIVYLSIGSNLGARSQLINKTIELLKQNGAIESVSKKYESKAVGFESENDFLNIMIKYRTNLEPESLLVFTQSIEKEIGRVKTTDHYEDRFIDIDIIFFDQIVLESDQLKIPHPRYRTRNFVLEPLRDIDDVQDPLTFILTSQLLRQ